MSDQAEHKRRLRSFAAARVAAVSPQERRRAEEAIVRALVRTRSFTDAAVVLGYVALPDEVDVSMALQVARQGGATVYLPCADRDGLRFREWISGAPLGRGRFGVYEPKGPELAAPCGLCLVPGRLFDRTGARLGRGGGYYDRLIESAGEALTTVGVAYSCQMVDVVVMDSWDRRVGAVITEDGWSGRRRLD